MRVIARGYGGEPLDREVASTACDKLYLVNPSALDADDDIASVGVGFPVCAVFQYESALLAGLQSAYARGDALGLAALWRKAQPARTDAL